MDAIANYIHRLADAAICIAEVFIAFFIPYPLQARFEKIIPFIFQDIILFFLIGLITWILFPKKLEKPLKCKIRTLWYLACAWIFDVLWSGLFLSATPCARSNTSPGFVPAHPDWVFYPIYAMLPFAMLFSLYSIWQLKGARWFATWLSLIQGYGLFMWTFGCLAYLGGGLCGL